MAEGEHPKGPEAAPGQKVIQFRLYVAGNLPNSRRAAANLRAFCLEHLPGRHLIEILDVFEVPERALEDRIALTPQLVAETPHGVRRIAGDLSDRTSLLAALDAASLQ